MTGIPRIPFTSLVANLPSAIPFTGPETLERKAGNTFRARVGANESAFGPSPRARAAMATEIERAGWYGDPESFELRRKLARIHNVDIAEIVIGAGIDELLGNIVRMTVAPGQAAITSAGAYPTLNYHVRGFGGLIEAVPYRDAREDPPALIDAARRTGAPLIYISNPDNPMGSWHDASTIEAMIGAVPDGALLIVDEAYADFAEPGIIPAIDSSNPRVIRLRTFSKAHGLAGARIGYAIAHREVIAGINRIRNHFGVNRLAQAAAIASLDDSDFLASVCREVAKGRSEYARLASELGMEAHPSMTNFVTIDTGSNERAKALLETLDRRGIFIRMPGVPPLDRCIRITVGTDAERAIVAETLRNLIREGL
ncbi:MAG: aminotransferase class I/II-fold pyridoxal phosphate-dependent enzyme [Geminicoccaceae bacterium]|nr:aminotransferase class I/II-fold pyridoxal phosphate-dependent enzyme [Geminicoccaceae bacterium]MCB9945328.1 aminotransferase class I/II-fold pyridoxal phosphate-dependent enzyme [Geminicoccaceae bacterium]